MEAGDTAGDRGTGRSVWPGEDRTSGMVAAVARQGRVVLPGPGVDHERAELGLQREEGGAVSRGSGHREDAWPRDFRGERSDGGEVPP